jgi:hypothetical protein
MKKIYIAKYAKLSQKINIGTVNMNSYLNSLTDLDLKIEFLTILALSIVYYFQTNGKQSCKVQRLSLSVRVYIERRSVTFCI